MTGMPRASAASISMRTKSVESSSRRVPSGPAIESQASPITARKTSHWATRSLRTSRKSRPGGIWLSTS